MRSLISRLAPLLAVALFASSPVLASDDSRQLPPFDASTAPIEDGLHVGDEAFHQTGSGCVSDPTGDVTPSHPQAAKADMTRYCVTDTTTSYDTAAQLVAAPDPGDPNWTNGSSGLGTFLETTGDSQPDYLAVAGLAGGTPTAEVYDINGNFLCDAPASVSGTTLATSIPKSCVGNPTSAILVPLMGYSVDANTFLTDDLSNGTPEGGGSTPPADPPPAQPDPNQATRSTKRLAGASRHETSVAISQFQFPDGAGRVYLSRDDNFADSISGASLTGGPVLLVPSCGSVPASVLTEVRRLGANEVIALGGTGAICDQVLTDVANA